MSLIRTYFEDFLSLFYPKLCLSCRENLPIQQKTLCLKCQFRLPKTNFHLEKENPFTQRFYGRIDLYSGAALYYFTKAGLTQQLIHELKYNGKKSIGYQLGQLYGSQLLASPHFHSVDLIIPVPLHPRRERQRGYNQSDQFASGLSDTMQRPWSRKYLYRKVATTTQTKKSQLERFTNVASAFDLRDGAKLKDLHILLVDDVLTTGATLEACAQVLLNAAPKHLSLATIAIAGDY